MKLIAKIILIILTLSLAFSVCGCTAVKNVTRDIPRAIELAKNLSELSKIGDQELALEQAEQYLHEKSGLTKDTILEQIKENEAIKALNLEGTGNKNISVGNIGTPSLKGYDENLGGNIYEVSAVVTVNGQPLNVVIQLLSDDAMMGLYSFDITSGN